MTLASLKSLWGSLHFQKSHKNVELFELLRWAVVHHVCIRTNWSLWNPIQLKLNNAPYFRSVVEANQHVPARKVEDPKILQSIQVLHVDRRRALRPRIQEDALASARCGITHVGRGLAFCSRCRIWINEPERRGILERVGTAVHRGVLRPLQVVSVEIGRFQCNVADIALVLVDQGDGEHLSIRNDRHSLCVWWTAQLALTVLFHVTDVARVPGTTQHVFASAVRVTVIWVSVWVSPARRISCAGAFSTGWRWAVVIGGAHSILTPLILHAGGGSNTLNFPWWYIHPRPCAPSSRICGGAEIVRRNKTQVFKASVLKRGIWFVFLQPVALPGNQTPTAAVVQLAVIRPEFTTRLGSSALGHAGGLGSVLHSEHADPPEFLWNVSSGHDEHAVEPVLGS
eukprot:1014176-Rhodomonas_salina.2